MTVPKSSLLLNAHIMADGQLFKPEKDYTKEVDKQLPEAQKLAKVQNSLPE